MIIDGEFLAGTVDINAVVRQYCRNTETKDHGGTNVSVYA